ncbi:hypothetical protein E2493_03365 [Sphingomonas parva]|uniref:NnrS family protein n=1 Tax=Sphingomonas parva TaxID=2555898 RepID=A0A4Y8ZXS4_9SPHN|nr:NnrS family protein [Sphingomonas parva]TFI59669.1 hypothetical protein E2493_03365 [Sphingomonas parva]
MTTDILSVRSARAAAAPPVLRGAYRLLFPAGALWAVVVAALWIGALAGEIVLPTAMAPLAWHQHEMLFGYLGAIIVGFLSAAIPNWTGRPAFAGIPVAAAIAWWLSARLALLFSSVVPPLAAALLDVGFFVAAAALAAREILAAGNRNLPMPLIILLFAAANGLHHAETMGASLPAGLAVRAGFSIVLLLICMIGGRIIPAFTRNWLVKAGREATAPAMPNGFDKTVVAGAALALAAWTFAPDARATGPLLIVAGLLHAARLARWSGLRTRTDPLLFILHLAYAWLPVGLVLLGLALSGAALPSTMALHALAAGAMGTITLAVMTRASLGHTGRPLVADGWTVAVYVLVTLGALLRVLSPVLPLDYLLLLKIGGAAWGGAFLLFVLAYAPKLAAPRVDGRI